MKKRLELITSYSKQLTSCSVTETLDVDGKVWYSDYSNIDIENLTLKESDED